MREGQRKRGRERILSRLHTQHRAQQRTQSHNPEIRSQSQKLDTQVTEPPRCPNLDFFKKINEKSSYCVKLLTLLARKQVE